MKANPSPLDLREDLAASERRAEGLQARLEGTQGILDAISEAIYIQDAEGRFLEVNAGAARMYGYPKDFFVGKTSDFLSAPGRNDMALVATAFKKALLGEPQQFEFWGLTRDGRSFPKDVHLNPGTYLGQQVVIAIAQDISGRMRAEQVRDAAYRISEATLVAKDLQTLYKSVHTILRTLLPAENCYIALHDANTNTITWPYWVDQVDDIPPPRRFGRGLTEYVIRTGQPQLLDEAKLAELVAAGEAEFIGSESLAWMGVPLRNDQRVYGALVIQSYEGGYHYLPEDLDMLSFVSAQIAMAIDRKVSEEKIRLISAAVDVAQDSFFWINEASGIEFVNAAACQGLGYTREELQSLTIPDIDPSITLEHWKANWVAVRQGTAKVRETTHRKKDGTFRPVEIARVMVTSEGRELIFASVRDLTERKMVEASLVSSEEKFSRVFHANPDAININRLDGTYLDVNDAFTRMSGWSREETLGRSTLELGLWGDLADRDRMQQMLQAEGHFVGLEAPFRMKDGSLRTGLVSGTLIQVDGETCLLTITRDITERKAVESALRYSEDKFFRAFQASPDAINLTRLDDGTYMDVSQGFVRLTGWTPEEAIGRSALDLNIWVDPRDRQQAVELIRSHGEYTGLEIPFRRKDGSLLTGLMSGKVMEVDGIPCLLSVTRDISDRKATEQALAAERGLFVGGPVMVFKWRAEPGWPVEYASPNVEAILGYPIADLLEGKISFESLIHPEDLPRIYQEITEATAKDLHHREQQYRLRTASGEYRWFYDFSTATATASQSSPAPFLGYLLDITDRRQAEDALRQSQKLESLGILAGGIAHDFNNLLTVVLGNLNLAQMHLPEHAPAQPYLANMEATVLRATELTKQMLAYSGRGHFLVKPQDLNTAVREVTHLLEVSISKKIWLRFDLEPGLPAIHADAAQIQQVVMNLVTNASDAIGDREGIIHLTTSEATLDERELQATYRGEALAPGRYVLLEVADTGIGMTSEVMTRIFDPFFTTKGTGRGLGLSAMLGILRGHGAGLCITSEVGRGSSFRLCFPASEERPAQPTTDPEATSFHPLRGRVLLVDDENLILQTIGSALEALGLEVLTARDGLEALERFRGSQPRPDLVLMDLTMPRMDGREAFLAMHELDPSIPVVLSSGFTERDTVKTLSGLEPAGFMQKPYQIRELRRMLQRVLGG